MTIDFPVNVENPDATLWLDSWAGRSGHKCAILKETPKRYQIILLEDCLKGAVGEIIYVPKYAITRSNT